jgi:hypothetical protein
MRPVRAITRLRSLERTLAFVAIFGMGFGLWGSAGILMEAYGQSGTFDCSTCNAVPPNCGNVNGATQCIPLTTECGGPGGGCTPVPNAVCGDLRKFVPGMGCVQLVGTCGGQQCV